MKHFRHLVLTLMALYLWVTGQGAAWFQWLWWKPGSGKRREIFQSDEMLLRIMVNSCTREHLLSI